MLLATSTSHLTPNTMLRGWHSQTYVISRSVPCWKLSDTSGSIARIASRARSGLQLLARLHDRGLAGGRDRRWDPKPSAPGRRGQTRRRPRDPSHERVTEPRSTGRARHTHPDQRCRQRGCENQATTVTHQRTLFTGCCWMHVAEGHAQVHRSVDGRKSHPPKCAIRAAVAWTAQAPLRLRVSQPGRRGFGLDSPAPLLPDRAERAGLARRPLAPRGGPQGAPTRSVPPRARGARPLARKQRPPSARTPPRRRAWRRRGARTTAPCARASTRRGARRARPRAA